VATRRRRAYRLLHGHCHQKALMKMDHEEALLRKTARRCIAGLRLLRHGGTIRVCRRLATGALPAPSLLSPAADARFSLGQAILFDWSDVAGAASYTIQVAGSSSFSSPLVLEQTVSASQLGTARCRAEDVVARARERCVGKPRQLVGGASLRSQGLTR